MALFRKFFYRKPPEGLLEISERVFGKCWFHNLKYNMNLDSLYFEEMGFLCIVVSGLSFLV